MTRLATIALLLLTSATPVLAEPPIFVPLKVSEGIRICGPGAFLADGAIITLEDSKHCAVVTKGPEAPVTTTNLSIGDFGGPITPAWGIPPTAPPQPTARHGHR